MSRWANRTGRTTSTATSSLAGVISSGRPRKSALRLRETAAESEPVGAVSSRQESILFAPLGAIVSLHSRPRGQARLGPDWKGAGNIGRYCGTSTLVRAGGTWTLIAVLVR